MLKLSKISNKQLLHALQLTSLDNEVKTIDINQLIDEQILPDSIRDHLKKRSGLSRSVHESLEIVGGLIETWWVVTSLASLAVFFTIGAGIFIGIVGIVYTCCSYLERVKNDNELMEAYQASTIKLLIVNELISRTKLAFNLMGNSYKVTPYVASKTKIFGIGVLTSIIIFFSYFYGINSIIQSLGYVSAASYMISPLGIAIALIVGIGLGVYFGYKYHQDKKYTHKIKSEQKYLDTMVDSKTQFCALTLLNNKSLETEEKTCQTYTCKPIHYGTLWQVDKVKTARKVSCTKQASI